MLGPGGAVRRALDEREARRVAEPDRLVQLVLHGARPPRGDHRAQSNCRLVLPLIHFIPDLLTYSMPF